MTDNGTPQHPTRNDEHIPRENQLIHIWVAREQSVPPLVTTFICTQIFSSNFISACSRDTYALI